MIIMFLNFKIINFTLQNTMLSQSTDFKLQNWFMVLFFENKISYDVS